MPFMLELVFKENNKTKQNKSFYFIIKLYLFVCLFNILMEKVI